MTGWLTSMMASRPSDIPHQSVSNSNKRKRLISDFFSSKRQCPEASGPPPKYTSGYHSLTPSPSPRISSVPGLAILPDFVSSDEEQQLLDFLYSAKCTWRTDLIRRCMHFGGTYCLYSKSNFHSNSDKNKKKKRPEVLQAPPVPSELSWLIDRFISKGVFAADQSPQYCIVNEYIGAQGISAHVENFSFGEPVVGLSLLSPVHMRFHELTREDGGSVRSGQAAKAEKTGRVEDVLLEGRSLCVMRGESRWKWQHEILRSKKRREPDFKRVSLTFRWKKGG